MLSFLAERRFLHVDVPAERAFSDERVSFSKDAEHVEYVGRHPPQMCLLSSEVLNMLNRFQHLLEFGSRFTVASSAENDSQNIQHIQHFRRMNAHLFGEHLPMCASTRGRFNFSPK